MQLGGLVVLSLGVVTVSVMSASVGATEARCTWCCMCGALACVGKVNEDVCDSVHPAD